MGIDLPNLDKVATLVEFYRKVLRRSIFNSNMNKETFRGKSITIIPLTPIPSHAEQLPLKFDKSSNCWRVICCWH
jgi:hypothetical protein